MSPASACDFGFSPSISRASATVAARRPMSSAICRALAISSPLDFAISPFGQIEVVLEAGADVAAEVERGGEQLPLVARDPDHLPVVGALGAVGDLLGHERDVLGHRPDAAGDPHHQRDLQRGLQRLHVEERVEVGDVAGVEALVLGLDSEREHLLDELGDQVEAVLEHRLEDEVLAPPRVLGVVHRAHVQRGDVGGELAQVREPLFDGHADRAGRVVDDHVADLVEDRPGDRAEVLDLIRGHAVGGARVDVDLGGALVDGPPGLGRVLLRRVRDRRALVAVRDRPRDRAAEDHRDRSNRLIRA